MSGSEKLRARKRAVEAQRRANEKRANLERANVDDAASVRVLLQRLRAVDAWESVRLDQVNENVRMDAARKRVSHFVNLQTVTGRMRDRGRSLLLRRSRFATSKMSFAERVLTRAARSVQRSLETPRL